MTLLQLEGWSRPVWLEGGGTRRLQVRETAGETEGFPALGSWVSSEVSSILKCVCLSVYLQSFSSGYRGVKPHWRTVSLSLALRVETHQGSDPHIHTDFSRQKHANQLTTEIKETINTWLNN